MTENCYKVCNKRYTATQPERLFCKKGCDNQDDIAACKSQGCNKLCIKTDQENRNLWFKFLYRAPTDPHPCLQACIQGCINRIQESE